MDADRDPQGSWRPRREIQLDPKIVGRVVMLSMAGVLALILVFSSFYTVEPEERAVVLRFGRHSSTTDPGLHFKLPFGIDTAIKVPVTEVRKLEFGFGTARSDVRTTYRANTREDVETKLMLTGDLNLVSLDWVVQYQIAEPAQWLFNLNNKEKTIGDLAESAMRAIVGDHTIDEVLRNRESIAGLAQSELQRSLNAYEAGVKIVTVQLQDVTPPPPVAESFNEVNKAQQERSRAENEAMQEYNRVIPLAKGEAKQRIGEAEGYAIDRVNRSKGDIAKFTELLAEYNYSKEVTRKRLYLETIEAVLPNVKRVVVASEDGVLKLLPLEREGGR